MASGLIAGIALQFYLDLPPVLYLIVTALLCGVWIIRFFLKIQPKRSISILFIFLSSLLLGSVRYGISRFPGPDDIAHLTGKESQLATIRGIVDSSIRIEDRSQWAFGDLQFTEPDSTFILSVRQVNTSAGWQTASGRIYVRVGEPLEDIQPGDLLELHGQLSTPGRPSNPGMFDFRTYLSYQGIYLTASVPSRKSIEVIESDRSALVAILRQKISRYAHDCLLSWGGDQERFSVLPETLLLGNRSRLDPKTYHAFRKTGLAHFLSLSGMHVGILAGLFWWLTKTAGFEKRLRAIICLLLIGLFALSVPPRPPTMRAVFIAAFFFVSAALRQRSSPVNTLALAAIVSLLIQPAALLNAGWQLSYMTVFCILLFYHPIQRKLLLLLHRLPPILNTQEPGPLRIPAWKVLIKCCDLLAVGLAAWLGSAGLILYHFGQINPLAALWTMLCFPLVGGILTIGFLKIVLAPVFPTLAAIGSITLNLLSNSLIGIVEFLASIDVTAVTVGAVSGWIIVIFYGTLFGLPLLPRRVGKRLILTGIVSAVVIVSLGYTKWTQTHSGDLKLTVLSVGHGLAAVMQMPDGKNLIFDTGSISSSNPGGRVVIPFLQHHGIDRIEAILLSHGDLDHYNGIPELLTILNPETVYVNATVSEKAESSAATRKLIKRIESSGAELRSCGAFRYEDRGLVMRSIWPDRQAASDTLLSSNDRSEVVLLEYAGRRVLLCGDVEDTAQERICAMYPDLRAEVLLLPHHGSMTGLSRSFVEMLDPEILIASCSARRQESAYHDDSRQVFYTPEHGAVRVTIKADGTLDAVGFLDTE